MAFVLQQLRLASRRACPVQATSTSASQIFAKSHWRALTYSNPRLQNSYDERARKLHQKSVDDATEDIRRKQSKRPWLREGADDPPVSADGEGDKTEPLTKGKLLTTPTRLLKLILPLPISVEKGQNTKEQGSGRAISPNDTIKPLALLVHPQQPLSYVERLIQAEIPPIIVDNREKIPNVYFRAEDTESEQDKPNKSKTDEEQPNSPHVASYSGLGHEARKTKDSDKAWVRWSGSTEIGDFIRDAARGREFAIGIDGYDVEMRVGVPSFRDRTYYMRLRLRKISRQIDDLAKIKQECDLLAHRGAHRLAKGGFALLAGYWILVYYVSFRTKWGWDLVEPVTYLAGLSTIMGGYLWFLYISRDLSYKAAMNVTVSKRQNALYEAKGFDIQKWEQVVGEANALRSEIRTVAAEYDVDWDEAKDLGGSERGEEVKKVLDKARRGQKQGDKDEEEDEGEDESEETKAEEEEEDKERRDQREAEQQPKKGD